MAVLCCLLGGGWESGNFCVAFPAPGWYDRKSCLWGGRPVEELEEWNDIYDGNRVLTGRVHRRGKPWKPGEYGLVVCVWVYDRRGHLLLTRRAPGKSFAGTWENSGGAAKAGETSLQAIRRELWEETGILAEESEFELLESGRDRNTFYDFYCLYRPVALEEIRLLPGETDNVMWASFGKIHWMIRTRKICRIIANQFRRQEKWLRLRSFHKDKT